MSEMSGFLSTLLGFLDMLRTNLHIVIRYLQWRKQVLFAFKRFFFKSKTPNCMDPEIHIVLWKMSLNFREKLVACIPSEDMAESIPFLKCLRNIKRIY